MRIRITPALVISVIALFIALGGVATAAVDLPWNSVGKEQLKWSAVDSSKVENRSLKAIDFAQGQLPQGEQGPKGERGAKGAKGDKGETGARGPAGVATSGSAGSATGHTLKDAAGTSLGEIIGITNVEPAAYAVLWDGGIYGYGPDGLTVTLSIGFASADCSGHPIKSYGPTAPTPSAIMRYEGATRYLTGVVGSPHTAAAFKITSTLVHVPQVYFIDYNTGVCDLWYSDPSGIWGIQLDQVPAPPSSVQLPLTPS